MREAKVYIYKIYFLQDYNKSYQKNGPHHNTLYNLMNGAGSVK